MKKKKQKKKKTDVKLLPYGIRKIAVIYRTIYLTDCLKIHVK